MKSYPQPLFHRQVRTTVLIAAVLVAGISLMFGSSSRLIGQWLVINQAPKKSDAIIVLGGGPINRIQHAASLYHAGYAPYLILSGGSPDFPDRTQAEVMASQATRKFGVPENALVLDNRSLTTYQNALDTRKIMIHFHWHSAIIVSSDYHMRRVAFLFSRVFHEASIHLIYSAASDPFFRPNRWWANTTSAEITLSEYLKLAANVVQVETLGMVSKATHLLRHHKAQTSMGETNFTPKTNLITPL